MPSNVRRSVVAPLRLDKLPSVVEKAIINPHGDSIADDISTEASTDRSHLQDEAADS